MISEKRPPDAGGVPGPAVGVCLTGSLPEDHLISTGPVGLQRRVRGSCWPPCRPPHAHSRGRPWPSPSQLHLWGGVEAASQAGSGCGSEDCLLRADSIPLLRTGYLGPCISPAVSLRWAPWSLSARPVGSEKGLSWRHFAKYSR